MTQGFYTNAKSRKGANTLSSSALILPYRGVTPKLGNDVYIAETAVVAGDVEIGDDSSVWFNCVVRGDVNNVTIGKRTNIQDGTVIHVSSTLQGTYIGDDVTVGHMALLHACTIEDGAFIGMQACVMDGAIVQSGAMVAAGALVTPGKVVEPGQLWAGSPAKFMRDLAENEAEMIKHSAPHYVKLAAEYLAHQRGGDAAAHGTG